MVKQTGRVRHPLNATLVDVVMRSILPPFSQQLSATEVRDAIETHLQSREEDIWVGWMVKHSNMKENSWMDVVDFKCLKCLQAGDKVPQDMKKLLLVLMMTLPGSPAVQYYGDIDQTQVSRVSQDRF